MVTLTKNPVLLQLRELLSSAIELKEQFDKNDFSNIDYFLDKFLFDLETLTDKYPKGLLETTNLPRHTQWLKKRIDEGRPEYCRSDIRDICYSDIFAAEEKYLEHLTTSRDLADRFYDWQNIHVTIKNVAKSRFETSHFADAVEASFKEINDIVKRAYLGLTNKEVDGVKLMRLVFTSSANNNFEPIFKLADNTTETGRNIQQGYMDIFGGAMAGIRNPKAHANMDVHPDESWEIIVLASHLMRMWEKFN